MRIILPRRIVRKELDSKNIENDLRIIRKGFEKGIYETIKGYALPGGTRLIKVYATTIGGARRIVYLLNIESEEAVFLFFRKKNDRIGENISISNPEFKKKMHEYIEILLEDIENNNFDVIEFESY